MVHHSRSGSFSPNPSSQLIQASHCPRLLHTGTQSATASPGSGSPTGSSSKSNIAVLQAIVLLSTIREDKDDPHNSGVQLKTSRKPIDKHGMEVFGKYFARLVATNAAQIFPTHGNACRVPAAGGNMHLLVAEIQKLAIDFSHARKMAESIETGDGDVFRDFDLSTFLDFFKLDALEKVLFALAFKLGPRSDLMAKADAILSTNFPTFVNILSRATGESHGDLAPDFLAELVDRYIQVHPPNFGAAAKKELEHKVLSRYHDAELPPTEVLAALDLVRVLADKPSNALAFSIYRTGLEFTADVETCSAYLQDRPSNVQPSEEQVSVALLYTTISLTPRHNPSVLVAALRRILPATFAWQSVLSYFDRTNTRITPDQFLRLYHALRPISEDDSTFEMQRLWGGEWENPETQLSFISALTCLTPEQLDATTIPGLTVSFKLDEYAQSPQSVRQTASLAVKQPLVSQVALSAIFNVALHSTHASQSDEAKRLFQNVVVNKLPVFVVSAFGVPKPWPPMATETLLSLFDTFFGDPSVESDFVLDSVWRKDRAFVMRKLVDAHSTHPQSIAVIFEHSVRQRWLDDLVDQPLGLGLDLAAFAHAQGYLDLQQWARRNADRSKEIAPLLMSFLSVKANHENDSSRPTAPLKVSTVFGLLQILEEFAPKNTVRELIEVQRKCIQAYPRLINYGEGYDDMIDANGQNGNALSSAADTKMQDYYKKMYNNQMEVRDIVDVLEQFKHSREPMEQEVFACMIHGLFDEYAHYVNYPLEALAKTAVLFGGLISHRLISDLPLQVGLGMILESLRDFDPNASMFKFGMQALKQFPARFREWPGFCKQLLQIPGLQVHDEWKKAEQVVRDHDAKSDPATNGTNGLISNGNTDDVARAPPFRSINVDPLPPGAVYEEPEVEIQEKIQFLLNNTTDNTLQTRFSDLALLMEEKYQQWFASHLVEQRAKMQPNYHHVYLDLVKKFEDRALLAEILRETLISVQEMLDSDLAMQNSTERSHLKNLGGWLGLLTLARDKPIKHKNIAFKDLLIEAHDTKRLVVVIPFVCKVLIQGKDSNVFRPPNPWLMDIIHLLIELYHNAELKLNLKFEIEVLCKGLHLDHKSIEPSTEIQNRALSGETADMAGPETLDVFENLSNGIGAGMPNTLSPHVVVPSIPDLSSSLTVPSTEAVSPARLHDIVRQALMRALQDIIQPVVERSVTIAAISTRDMIHKDFVTEPDENRVRTSAINMVKSTAGNLALVTSKEPLRANFMNYMRTLSNDLAQGLPEGVIIMCVNSNLDLAAKVIQESAEDRAVPEIEDYLEPEMEARRRHRITSNEPYVDPGLSRWGLAIPGPYRLSPSQSGLTHEQMAIYEDFPRQRAAVTSAISSHPQSSSNATNALANELLQDGYSSIPSIPAPAETPAMPHIGSVQLPHYQQVHATLANGRQAASTAEQLQPLVDRIAKLLNDLHVSASSTRDEHFHELPRQHPVVDLVDNLGGAVIKGHQQYPNEFVVFVAHQTVCMMLQKPEISLLVESLAQVLENLRRIGGQVVSEQIRTLLHQQPGHLFLHIPVIRALVDTDLLDWDNIDAAVAKALEARNEGSLEFFHELLSLTLLPDAPVVLFSQFLQSLEEAWSWIMQDPGMAIGKQLKDRVLAPPNKLPDDSVQDAAIRKEQKEYVFDEWVALCQHRNASEKVRNVFVQQMRARRVIEDKAHFFEFVRQAIDKSVDRNERILQIGGTRTESYQAIDALADMITVYLKAHEDDVDGRSLRAEFLDSTLGFVHLVLNHHLVQRGAHFNQGVFVRLWSRILHSIGRLFETMSEVDRKQVLLSVADRLRDASPVTHAGFTFGYLELIGHRSFLPNIMHMPDDAGYPAYTRLLQELLDCVRVIMTQKKLPDVHKEIIAATIKLLSILHHDFPQFLAANHLPLCRRLPSHAVSLINLILHANPLGVPMPFAFQPGLKIERMPEARDPQRSIYDPTVCLRHCGLLDIVDRTLLRGPSEDAIAQMAHAICQPGPGKEVGFGCVPVGANRSVIDALVTCVGNFATARACAKNDSIPYTAGSSDVRTLQMLVSELPPEPRYYFLEAIVNNIRYCNAHTLYFSHLLLAMFGRDSADPEEMETGQQIARILFQRLAVYEPRPWGLLITFCELVKNEKYAFWDQPFIKADDSIRHEFQRVLDIVAAESSA